MYKAVLSAVAVAALSAPALAQQIPVQGPPQSGQEMQQELLPLPGASQAMAGHAISPQLLTSGQIREIQRALEARGANSIRVDGEWGPDVEAALKDFQKSENMISQNGELDSLTLMALGLDPLGFGLSGTTETTGQAAREAASPQERTPDIPQEQLIRGGEQGEQQDR
jgi:peptidoglycan hydrolase-like protein with peptidoglycan-binding domain